MKKTRNISTIYFGIICIIAVLFILSPLIIRIPFFYQLIKWLLSVFKDDQYKNTYISAVGSIIGTFLAITGVIWTEKLLDKRKAEIQNKKNALIMYYDFHFALEGILEIMNEVYPLIKGTVMPDDDNIITTFRKLKKKRRIYINPDWRQLVTDLQDVLSPKNINEAQLLYYYLSMISISFNAPMSETSRKEDINSYSIMCKLVDIEKKPVSISIKREITDLQDHIANIAGVKDLSSSFEMKL